MLSLSDWSAPPLEGSSLSLSRDTFTIWFCESLDTKFLGLLFASSDSFFIAEG